MLLYHCLELTASMKITKIFDKIPTYFAIISMMLIAIFGLFIYFAVDEYNVNYHNLNEELGAETERVEIAFTDIIKHTEFMMKVIIMQIKSNPRDLEYINNIISKYSVNPKLNNVLSWSTFSWLDSNHIKKMDTVSGLAVKPSDHSNREYIQKAKKQPGKMHLGATTFGFTSQRYVIPAVVGIEEEGEYLGALNIGFDLINLNTILSNALKDYNVYFALLDKTLDIILQSSNNLVSSSASIDTRELKRFIDDNNIDFGTLTTFSDINLLTDGANHYLHKMSEYPFVVYLHYDNKSVTRSFWRDIVYRIIEIFVISIISIIIIVVIYRREKILRDKAENSKKLAVQASRAKTDFLAFTAHELRSPLNFIISGSEMMMNKVFGNLNKKYLDYVASINQSGKELLEFIDDLLDNTKSEDQGFKIKDTTFDVRKIILRSVKVNDISYNHKISIETHFETKLPNLITDPKRLLQILNNIISNSIKYSPEGSLLSISVNMNDGEMLIKFQDQGYGMNKEELKKSMNKYVANAYKHKVQSTGLGLPLVKNLLDQMGAEFFINSVVDSGTKIVIRFPQNKIDGASND